MGEFTFKKKPVAIEAWQNLPQNRDNKPDWLREAEAEGEVIVHHIVPDALAVLTKEGVMRADKGDLIIRGTHGELYPCKEEIFVANYEAAPDEEATIAEPAELVGGPPEVDQADKIAKSKKR